MKKKHFWAIVYEGEILELFITRKRAREWKEFAGEKIVKVEVKVIDTKKK